MAREQNPIRVRACHRILQKAIGLYDVKLDAIPSHCFSSKTFLRLLAISLSQIDCSDLGSFMKRTIFNGGKKTFVFFLKECCRICETNKPPERIGSILACNLTSDITQTQLNSKHSFGSHNTANNMNRRHLYQMTEIANNSLLLKPGRVINDISFKWSNDTFCNQQGEINRAIPDMWTETFSSRSSGTVVNFKEKKKLHNFFKMQSDSCYCMLSEKKYYLNKVGTFPMAINTLKAYYACAHASTNRWRKDYLAESVIKFVYSGKKPKHLNRAGLNLEKESTLQKASFEAMTSVVCKKAYHDPNNDKWEYVTKKDIAGLVLFGCTHPSLY